MMTPTTVELTFRIATSCGQGAQFHLYHLQIRFLEFLFSFQILFNFQILFYFHVCKILSVNKKRTF